MNVCPNCGNPVEAGAVFCRSCGYNMNAAGQPIGGGFPPPPPPVDYTDHTSEFDAQEVAKNKLYAALPYFLGAIGIIIAVLVNQGEKSAYMAFHIKQGIKLAILSAICAIIPFIGAIAVVVLFIISLVCGFGTLNGKSKEPPIVSSLDFLK